MAGVLPSGLPSFAAYTDIDRTSDDLLVYDSDAQQLKTRPAGDLYNLTAANTVQINQLSDFPAPSGGVITLLPATVYRINADIDLGANSLLMANGTAIIGETAQGNTLTSSNVTTINTTATGFSTCIIEGPLSITNTNAAGVCVNVTPNVFLIYNGVICRTPTSANQYGIYCEAGAYAVSVVNYTMIGLGTKLYALGLTGGATLNALQSTSLSGNGIVLDGTAGVTSYGPITIQNCNIVCTGSGSALLIRGKSANSTSPINIINSTFSTSTGSAAIFESSTSGRFVNLVSTGCNYYNTGGGASKHAIDMTNCWLDVGLITNGVVSTSGTGTSYAIKANSGQVTAVLGLGELLLQNTVISTNLINGFTVKDLTVNVQGCAGLNNSGVRGGFYFDSALTGLWTSSGTPNTYTQLVGTASVIRTIAMPNVLERVTHSTSDTTNRLTVVATKPDTIRVSYSVSGAKTSATPYRVDFALFKNGVLLPGSESPLTMIQNEIAGVSLDFIDTTSSAGTDYYEIFAKTTAASQNFTFEAITMTIQD